MCPPCTPQGLGLSAFQWGTPAISDLTVWCQRGFPAGAVGNKPGIHRAQPWEGSGPPGRQSVVPSSELEGGLWP